MARSKGSRFFLSGNIPIAIANLKDDSLDLVFDAKRIYEYQLKRFKDFFFDDDLKAFKTKIACLSELEETPANLVRVYLVTELSMILLAMHNTEASVLDNLKLLKTVEPQHPEYINPNYISTLFIFQGSKMTFHCDVSVKNAIELPIAFYQENLLNKGAFRDAWYGKPRRDHGCRKDYN